MESLSLTFSIIRQFVYLVMLTLIVIIFWQVADTFKASAVQEYGIFESAQSVVLFLTAISFIIQSIINKAYRPVLFSLGMLDPTRRDEARMAIKIMDFYGKDELLCHLADETQKVGDEL